MKEREHIFALTKNEQRVVILVLLALLAAAVANHYRQAWSHPSRPVQVQPVSTPAATSGTGKNSVSDD